MTKLQILGTGCAKCDNLARNAESAAKEMGIEYKLEKVTNIQDILEFGVMITPALAVDGQVKSVGKVLKPSEIVQIISDS
jgi:small redox-active disulfide protein 2